MFLHCVKKLHCVNISPVWSELEDKMQKGPVCTWDLNGCLTFTKWPFWSPPIYKMRAAAFTLWNCFKISLKFPWIIWYIRGTKYMIVMIIGASERAFSPRSIYYQNFSFSIPSCFFIYKQQIKKIPSPQF